MRINNPLNHRLRVTLDTSCPLWYNTDMDDDREEHQMEKREVEPMPVEPEVEDVVLDLIAELYREEREEDELRGDLQMAGLL